MLTIRFPKSEWGKAWRAMIEVAPMRLVADDPAYEVLPPHLEMLTARGFKYEVVHNEQLIDESLFRRACADLGIEIDPPEIRVR